MSYYNPKIYNKENLSESDRRELDFWHDRIHEVIEQCRDETLSEGTGSKTLDVIINEVIETFCENLRIDFGLSLHDLTVSIIDSYEQEVTEQKHPSTYLYED